MRSCLQLHLNMKVRSFMRHAQEFTPVEVELSLTNGLPQISFLGMPDPFIRESVTRIKSALRAQGYDFPKAQQVLVQLRPSHLKKTSRGLDLAVAAALLWETEQVKKPDNISSLILYGELSLKGEVIIPDDIDDAEECISESEVVVTGDELKNFNGTVWALKQLKDLPESITYKTLRRDDVNCLRPSSPYNSFSQLQGELVSLLAAGGHTALMVGTPGSGKSATAECINCFMPAPDPEEWKSIRKISSYFHKAPTWRPNVVVHHSITPLAMTGGGSQIRPGEITRAHGGTLIMDELLEFKTGVQDAIREPLESCEIEIARQGKHVRMPANFQLIATSNLCRCGNYVPKKLQDEKQTVSK
jgi:magnesium chelatase family protein